MRDLVFKNLTSRQKNRKVISAREIINEDGITTKISKHLIYSIKETTTTEDQVEKIKPELFVIKEKNTKTKTETFFIKMKGGIYANCETKVLLVTFLHSLRIDLTPQKMAIS